MDATFDLKRQFAHNFNCLLALTGHSRKGFAETSGVSYRLIRRIITEGVSRLDVRNEDNLNKIAHYFALPNVKSLWWENLAESLLTTNEGTRFVEKFRPHLERRFGQLQVQQIDEEHLGFLETALGEDPKPKHKKPLTHLDKAREILHADSAKVQAFCVMINLIYADLVNET